MVWPVQGHETRLGCLDGGLRALDWTQRQLQGRTCTWSFFILFHPFFRVFPPPSFFFQIPFSCFSSSRMFTNNQSVSPQRECYGISSFSPSSPLVFPRNLRVASPAGVPGRWHSPGRWGGLRGKWQGQVQRVGYQGVSSGEVPRLGITEVAMAEQWQSTGPFLKACHF